MKVHLYGTLRLLVGRKDAPVRPLPGAALRDVLALLVETYPDLRPVLLKEDGSLRSDLPLFLNGRNPRLLPHGLETIPGAEDVLSLFSPVSSGRMNVEVLRLPASARRREAE